MISNQTEKHLKEMLDKSPPTPIQQVREALEESWKIVYSSCVMCDKRTCPLGEHSEQPQCNRFPNEDRECHIKQSIIKSNEALLTLQGKELVSIERVNRLYPPEIVDIWSYLREEKYSPTLSELTKDHGVPQGKVIVDEGIIPLLVEILVKTLLNSTTPQGLKAFYHNPPVGVWVVGITHILRGGAFKAIGKVVGVSKDDPKYGPVTLELLNGTKQVWENESFHEISVPSEKRIRDYLIKESTNGHN